MAKSATMKRIAPMAMPDFIGSSGKQASIFLGHGQALSNGRGLWLSER